MYYPVLYLYPVYGQNSYYSYYLQPPLQTQLLKNRQYPPVDTTMLSQSIKEFKILMNQGEILLNRLSDTAYAKKLMEAAQHGNQSEVDRLIDSISGLHVPVQTNYTPSGTIFKLQSPAIAEGANCCTLDITLKWGK